MANTQNNTTNTCNDDGRGNTTPILRYQTGNFHGDYLSFDHYDSLETNPENNYFRKMELGAEQEN